MFAILETGNHQYKVAEGDVLEVELLKNDSISKDNKVNFESVLLVQDNDVLIGQPFVPNALVTAKVLDEIKAPKVIVFKKKSKKQYKRTKGHRQKLHKIQIEKIEVKSAAKKKDTAENASEPKTEEKTEEK